MSNEQRTFFKVGFFVMGSLAILAMLIFFIGEEQKFFLKMCDYTIQFTSVEGLEVGNPVKLDGVTVGRIRDIRLPESPGDRRITILVSVNKKYSQLIRSDSRARIRTLGLLGDKYIGITSGTLQATCVAPGEMIPSTQPMDMAKLFSSGEDTMDNLVAISANLREILEKINRGNSPINNVTQKASSNLDRLDRILSMIEEKQGTLGRLIADEAFADEVFENLQDASGNLKSISDIMKTDLQMDGTIWAEIMKNPSSGKQAVEMIRNISDISATLADIGRKLETKEEALLPRLLNDEKFAQNFIDDLKSTAKNLNSISQKLDRGDGSASLLINDPAIYDGIENVLYGINKSRFLKWLIQHERKKGEKNR